MCCGCLWNRQDRKFGDKCEMQGMYQPCYVCIAVNCMPCGPLQFKLFPHIIFMGKNAALTTTHVQEAKITAHKFLTN